MQWGTWLPDGCSQILRSYVFAPSGFWTIAPLRYAAKLDPFLSLDCAIRPPPWRNPRKGKDQTLPSGNLEGEGGRRRTKRVPALTDEEHSFAPLWGGGQNYRVIGCVKFSLSMPISMREFRKIAWLPIVGTQHVIGRIHPTISLRI